MLKPILRINQRVPLVVQWIKKPTALYEDAGLIPGLAQWVKGSGLATNELWHGCGCGVGHQLQLLFDP